MRSLTAACAWHTQGVPQRRAVLSMAVEALGLLPAPVVRIQNQLSHGAVGVLVSEPAIVNVDVDADVVEPTVPVATDDSA